MHNKTNETDSKNNPASLQQSAETEAKSWYTCFRKARPFSEVLELPPELKWPKWFPAVLVVMTAAGIAVGFLTSHQGTFVTLSNALYYAALFVYVAVSLLDLWEHFRLEKYVTGKYINFVVVPIGESILHGAIVTVLILFTQLAHPLAENSFLLNLFLLLAPVIFLCLGWMDELFYHRRRALHKEDILHTVSHLAAGTMMAALVIAKMINWTALGT